MTRDELVERILNEGDFIVIRKDEHEPWRGQFEESCTEWIEDQLSQGNEWAWCAVEVKCFFRYWRASDFLGGCSYESEDSFKTDVYYGDMRRACAQEIADNMISQYRTMRDTLKLFVL